MIETVDAPEREWSEHITMHMKTKGKERLDKIMVNRGLLKTRERAKALIMAGKVAVDGKSILKAGTLIRTDADIILRESDIPFVSRGGLKLDAALKAFCIDLREKVVMDIRIYRLRSEKRGSQGIRNRCGIWTV
jgi:ribosomal protein S4